MEMPSRKCSNSRASRPNTSANGVDLAWLDELGRLGRSSPRTRRTDSRNSAESVLTSGFVSPTRQRGRRGTAAQSRELRTAEDACRPLGVGDEMQEVFAALAKEVEDKLPRKNKGDIVSGRCRTRRLEKERSKGTLIDKGPDTSFSYSADWTIDANRD
jgi:hypothetical protein